MALGEEQVYLEAVLGAQEALGVGPHWEGSHCNQDEVEVLQNQSVGRNWAPLRASEEAGEHENGEGRALRVGHELC